MIYIAILKDLIVNGCARFLNKIYANDIDIGGTATFANLSTTGNATIGGALSVTGATTQTGKFTVNNVIEQHGDGIELYYSTPHIDFHYGNNTADYTSRIIESAQGVITITPKLSTPNASITNGSITTLNAQTIYAKDVDVSDTLKSYKWDISHVANLANDFTVSPTLQLGSGATITFSAINTSTKVCTFTVKDSSAISSDSLGGVTWTQYSKVKFTMSLNDIVNSNCNGYLTAKMNSTAGTMIISGTLDNVSGLAVNTAYNAQGATIMLYEVGAGSQSTTYPVGIRMTSYGSNKRSYIDIYGGTSTSSWNTPHVRIGNVGGLTFNGATLENQWGIYTDMGYFSGAIVSKEGNIGGFFIDQTNIHNNVTSLTDTSHTGIYLGTDGIRNYNTSGSKHVTIKDGTISANSVDLTGVIKADTGYIGGTSGWTIAANKIYSGTHSTWNSTAEDGLYLGTDGIAGGSGGIWYLWKDGSAKIGAMTLSAAGVLTVPAANVSGKLTAATIDGDKITANTITGDKIKAQTISADKLIIGDTNNYSQLSDSTASYWGFTADTTADGHWYTMNTLARDKFISDYFECQGGETFQVSFEISTSVKGNSSSGGTDSVYKGTAIGIYCYNDANSSVGILYSTRVTATSSATATKVDSTVGPISANARKFRIFVQTNSYGNFSGTMKLRNIRVYKASGPFITYVSASEGIKIHNASDTTNYLQMNSTAIKFFKNGTQKMYLDNSNLQFTNGSTVLAQFGTSGATIGQTTGTYGNVSIEGGTTNASIKIRQGSTVLSSFTSSGTTIGADTSGVTRTVITSSGVDFIRKDGSTDVNLAHIGYGVGTGESGTATRPFYSFGVRKNKPGISNIIGNYSVVEGYDNVAQGYCSHAEGRDTEAHGTYTHAEGRGSYAYGTGDGSHAEGTYTEAGGTACHAEGASTKAIGEYCHSEGNSTKVYGTGSHAEGGYAYVNADYSHAQNYYTVATENYQTVIGKFNKATEHWDEDKQNWYYTDAGDYAFIIGNGTNFFADDRSNALTVDWKGNVAPAMGFAHLYRNEFTFTDNVSGGTAVPNVLSEIKGDLNCFSTPNTYSIKVLKAGIYKITVTWQGNGGLSNKDNVKRFGVWVNDSEEDGFGVMSRVNGWQTVSGTIYKHIPENAILRLYGRNEAGAGSFSFAHAYIEPAWFD